MLSTLRGKLLLGLLGGQGAAIPDDVPINESLPSISSDGDPVTPGADVVIDVGGWANSPTSYTIDLYDAEYALVASDTGTTYTVQAGDAGKVLHPVVTAHNILGSSTPTSSLEDVAPVISSAVPTIGTQVDGDDGVFSGVPAYPVTYQWQRSLTGVSWSDIGGASSKNYTPVDADWGYMLRLRRIDDDLVVVGTSNATGVTKEVPAQTLGSELLTNANLSAWTGDNPDGYAIPGESGSNPMITEVGADGNPGTGSARLYQSGGTFERPLVRQTVLTIGNYYEASLDVKVVTTGQVCVRSASSNTLLGKRASAGMIRTVGRATNTIAEFCNYNSNNGDQVVDDPSFKPITLNTQLVAPSANMDTRLLYTLPGTPGADFAIMLFARVSDFGAGNYWEAWLRYTSGTQWDINLYLVTGFTRANKASATNIGTTNGVRILANGSSLKLYTTANGGADWTQRGGDVTDATYNTATGVNVLFPSTLTSPVLTYQAAA